MQQDFLLEGFSAFGAPALAGSLKIQCSGQGPSKAGAPNSEALRLCGRSAGLIPLHLARRRRTEIGVVCQSSRLASGLKTLLGRGRACVYSTCCGENSALRGVFGLRQIWLRRLERGGRMVRHPPSGVLRPRRMSAARAIQMKTHVLFNKQAALLFLTLW